VEYKHPQISGRCRVWRTWRILRRRMRRIRHRPVHLPMRDSKRAVQITAEFAMVSCKCSWLTQLLHAQLALQELCQIWRVQHQTLACFLHIPHRGVCTALDGHTQSLVYVKGLLAWPQPIEATCWCHMCSLGRQTHPGCTSNKHRPGHGQSFLAIKAYAPCDSDQ